MADWFLVLIVAAAAAAPLMGIANVGAFVLTRRAGLNPPRTLLVRGVLLLAVSFVFPRILPGLVLWTGVIVVLLLGEVSLWLRRAGILRSQPDTAPMAMTNDS